MGGWADGRIAIVPLGMLLAACATQRLSAHPPIRPSAQDPPALVVIIAVDQMRGDYLDRYGPQFTGGLARLAREGAVFTQAYQDHAMTSTAAGHASMLSGRYPASTGIIRNSAGVNDSAFPLLAAVAGPGRRRRRPQRHRCAGPGA
jgi:MYXO-CTERM domain-containing protein